MKKIISKIFAVFVAGMLFAASNNTGIGVRGAFGVPAGTNASDSYIGSNIALFNAWDFSFSLVGNINFDTVPGLAIRPEVGFYVNNFGFKSDGVKSKLSYNSIDVPVLFGYTIETGNFLVTPLVGPFVSFPVGDYRYEYDGDSATLKRSTIAAFGAAFGLEVGYKVNDSSVLNFDLRFATDFNRQHGKYSFWKYELLTRRELTLGLGYLYRFGR